MQIDDLARWRVMMANRRVAGADEDDAKTVRASVSLPENHYQELEDIAKQKRVSVSWVIRDAIQTYLADKYPLLHSSKNT